jgi:UDP-GlcNAc:undecaprenyl-phosphate GlcNAc-1-phosphate transferase
LGTSILIVLTHFLIFSRDAYSLSITFLFCTFLFLGLAASRSSFRVLDQLYSLQTKTSDLKTAILIDGADDAGVMVLQWLNHNPESNYHAVGFLDSDPFKHGRQIQGINVIGSLDELDIVIEKHEFQGILLTSKERMEAFRTAEIDKICKNHGIWLKRLQINFEDVE